MKLDPPTHPVGEPRFDVARLSPREFPYRFLAQNPLSVPDASAEHHLIEPPQVLRRGKKPATRFHGSFRIPEVSIHKCDRRFGQQRLVDEEWRKWEDIIESFRKNPIRAAQRMMEEVPSEEAASMPIKTKKKTGKPTEDAKANVDVAEDTADVKPEDAAS
jgi:hypothetical protein